MVFIALGLFEDVAMFGSKTLTSDKQAVFITTVTNLRPSYIVAFYF